MFQKDEIGQCSDLELRLMGEALGVRRERLVENDPEQSEIDKIDQWLATLSEETEKRIKQKKEPTIHSVEAIVVGAREEYWQWLQDNFWTQNDIEKRAKLVDIAGNAAMEIHDMRQTVADYYGESTQSVMNFVSTNARHIVTEALLGELWLANIEISKAAQDKKDQQDKDLILDVRETWFRGMRICANHMESCLISGGAGQFMGQEFAELIPVEWAVASYAHYEQQVLQRGPDGSEYWDTWTQILDYCVLFDPDTTERYMLECEEGGNNLMLVRAVWEDGRWKREIAN